VIKDGGIDAVCTRVWIATPRFPASVVHQDRREIRTLWEVNRDSCIFFFAIRFSLKKEITACSLTNPGLRIACYGLIVNKLNLIYIALTNHKQDHYEGLQNQRQNIRKDFFGEETFPTDSTQVD